MALPTPDYPGALWDGNEQSTANDIPGDDTRANGADHNEIAAEIVAIEDDLRKAVAAVGKTNVEDALVAIKATLSDAGGMIGAATIAQIDALTPFVSLAVIAASAGTPSAGSSDTLAIGDIAEYDGASWKRTVENSGGFPPAGTAALVLTSLAGQPYYSPFSAADENKIATWDGTSTTPSSLVTPVAGQFTLTRTGFSVGNLASYFAGPPGAWGGLTFVNNLIGEGLTQNPFGILNADPDNSTIELSGGKIAIKALGVTDAEVAAANKDGAAGTASMRTLGIGAQQAAAGDHGHDEVVDAVIAVADASGGATGAALTLDLKDRAGSALSRAAVVMILASDSQYGGQRDPNANVTFGTATKGSILASGTGWAVVKTDTGGEFDCTATNAVDEGVYFSVVTAEGVDALASGALVHACVPDLATWSA
jgi:hypothetical protein